MKNMLPTGPEFIREALIVIGGAVLAALVLSQFPALRTFFQKNING